MSGSDNYWRGSRRLGGTSRTGVRKEKDFRRAENPYECWDNPEDETSEHREDLALDLAIAWGAPLPDRTLGGDERFNTRRPKGWWKRSANCIPTFPQTD